jgi:hypothetical protein
MNNISGVTQAYYDWRQITGDDGWDWEGDPEKILNTFRAAGEALGGMAPMHPSGGTVWAPDLSGNSRDWTLPTQTVYTTLTAGKATIAFYSDPYWRS